MKSLLSGQRHLFAAIFAIGTYISYLVGPKEQFVPDALWLGVLLGLSYLIAFASSFVRARETVLLKLVHTFSTYLLIFYLYWIIGGLAANLSSATPPIAIWRLTLTYFIGFPIVLFKLLPALIVSMLLQATLTRFSNGGMKS